MVEPPPPLVLPLPPLVLPPPPVVAPPPPPLVVPAGGGFESPPETVAVGAHEPGAVEVGAVQVPLPPPGWMVN